MSGSVLDTKAISKPPIFNGGYREWNDWVFIFRSYISLLSDRYKDLMKEAEVTETSLGIPVDDADAKLGAALYHLLVMLVRGQGLGELKRAPAENGFEAWRLLCKKYEPTEKTRALGLLHQVLRFTFSTDVLEDMAKWEDMIQKYQQASGEVMPEGVLIATAMAGFQEPLRSHMQIQANKFKTYRELRDMVETFYSARRNWDLPGQVQGHNPDAMVEQVTFKGKGKGAKGKGPKGKGKSKGKEAGKGKSAKGQSPWMHQGQHQSGGWQAPAQGAKGKERASKASASSVEHGVIRRVIAETRRCLICRVHRRKLEEEHLRRLDLRRLRPCRRQARFRRSWRRTWRRTGSSCSTRRRTRRWWAP